MGECYGICVKVYGGCVALIWVKLFGVASDACR